MYFWINSSLFLFFYEVVGIIESRARGLDLLAHNYYELLYAFHINRHNFRKGKQQQQLLHAYISKVHLEYSLSVSAAGSVMFELGMRLGREVRTRLGLQKQVNCYLAALNCLRLIRPEYAWIVQPVSGAMVLLYARTHMSVYYYITHVCIHPYVFVCLCSSVRETRSFSKEELWWRLFFWTRWLVFNKPSSTRRLLPVIGF